MVRMTAWTIFSFAHMAPINIIHKTDRTRIKIAHPYDGFFFLMFTMIFFCLRNKIIFFCSMSRNEPPPPYDGNYEYLSSLLPKHVHVSGMPFMLQGWNGKYKQSGAEFVLRPYILYGFNSHYRSQNFFSQWQMVLST